MKHKHLKVTEQTHKLIKSNAKKNKMFIDEYIQYLITTCKEV